MSWITHALTRPLWAVWRCLPSSIRLAVYRWADRRYGEASHSIRVRMLPFGLVSKVSDVPQYEVHNIQFVGNNTTIPVPRILDVVEYESPTRLRGMIIMTRLEGETLENWVWDRVIRAPADMEVIQRLNVNDYMTSGDTEGLSAVLEQVEALPPPTLNMSDSGPLVQDLRDALKELRSLTPPASPAVASVSGGPVNCNRVGDSSLIGPCEDQQQFKDHIFAQANGMLFPHRMPALRRLAEPVHAKRHRICFTHADLAARNILVKDGRLSGIVDWEFAGWYPEYWELVTMEAQMLHQQVFHQFWDMVQLFGPEPYRDELALEWALWSSSGTMTVVGEAGDDLSCPRIVQAAPPAPGKRVDSS